LGSNRDELKKAKAEYPILHFKDKRAWADWLEAHPDAPGVRLRLAKAQSDLQSVTHADALDVALCYGWIDGQANRYDDQSWLLRFTPRGPRSVWSKRNREYVERLIANGEMQPRGLAAVAAAQAAGRWERAYDSPSNATVPADLQAALDQQPKAKAFFETLKGMKRYAFLHRIQTAIKPETRARRIVQFVEMLKRGETL
jgi:uncharacterized protein YdeI (YjbR/CyaY-like superfamily)